MDVTRNSRKRNRRSQSVSGTFTRSRSQLFAHRTRSGQIRPDPVRRQAQPISVPVPVPKLEKPYSSTVPFVGNGASQGFSESEYNILIQDICKKYSESDSEDNIMENDFCKKAKHDDCEISCATAKDLRARRVFPQSRSETAGLVGSSAVDSDLKEAELGFQLLSSEENCGLCVDYEMVEPVEIPDLGLSCEPQNLDRGTIELLDERGKLQDRVQIDGKNDGDCSEKVDDFGEEFVLATPPDAAICVNFGDARKMEEELPVKDTPLAGHAEENSGDSISSTKDRRRNSSVLKSKSVLRPRLPGKLFKAPGSVNYSRLMNIMGDDFGKHKLGHCHKDKKVVDGQGLELPLSSDNRGATKPEIKTDSLTMRDTNRPKLTSSPMQLDTECLSTPSGDGKCLSESKVDPTADFHGARDAENATIHNGCASEQLSVLNEDCIPTTLENSIDLTRNTQEKAIQSLCPKANKRNEPLKSKHVHKPYLHRKLIKTPGSVNYRRLLPYLKNRTNDNSGTSKFGDQTPHKKDEADLYANKFQLPLPSQNEEASINMQMTFSGPMNYKVDSNALKNILVNPANMLSQDFSELPMQLDGKEMSHQCLSASTVQAHSEQAVIGSKDECLSESKIVTNAAHHDGFNQVQNTISRQPCSESPPKDQNMLNISANIYKFSPEHHSSKENGLTDESKQSVNLEKHESVSRCPPEGQSLSQLDPNMLDVEENGTNSRAVSKNDDAVVLSHVSILNEEPQSEKIISEKSELPSNMAAHGGNKAGSHLNGLVYGSKIPSKGSKNKNASCAGEIPNGSESQTTLVLNRSPRFKLLKHAGSLNYKRLLPFLLNTNSCTPNNDHPPKLQKLLDHIPLLTISDSNLRVTPVSANDCVPRDDSTGNSDAQQETLLRPCDLNNDSSSPKSQIPVFQSSHGSCKVIQPQDEQIILNGPCKLENYTVSPIPALSKEKKSLETLRCSQSLSQLKVTEPLRAPAEGFKKGILRRNPRGCRGLCTCLNCVSYRLHAERAFEFSRNQLLDSEEVAQDLMKELSHLRHMLERYTDSVNDTPVFDGSQVKEACRKAFETEQLAKDRLSQMKDDLNIHCRTPSLQRPSVKFSDHVEEKVI